MVRVHDVRVVPFAIPLRQPLTTASGIVSVRRGLVVVLSDVEGRLGIGEATPHPAAPASALAAVREELERTSRQLRDIDVRRLVASASLLTPVARSAVDMAAHDLLGVATDRPVAVLLGGAQRAAVPVSALLAGVDDGGCARAARAAVERGFTTAKVKIGPDPECAVRRVAAVRAAAPSLRLRCDANGAWDASTAIVVARRLSRMDIAWLEQPVPPGDLAGLARVRHEGGVALAADEAVTGVEIVPRLAAMVDAVVVKLVQVGGLAAARATAQAAVRHGLRVTVTTGIETSIATAAALHLAAALPPPLEPCGLATGSLLADDLAYPVSCEGPAMVPPPGPGLGVHLRAPALAG
jgi:o-succinylbenzoate synthase